jgi:hypothetical protein
MFIIVSCIIVITMIIVASMHVIHLGLIEEQHFTYSKKLRDLLNNVHGEVQYSHELQNNWKNNIKDINDDIDVHESNTTSHVKQDTKQDLSDKIGANANTIQTNTNWTNTNSSSADDIWDTIEATNKASNPLDREINLMDTKKSTLTDLARKDILLNTEKRNNIETNFKKAQNEFEYLVNNLKHSSMRNDMNKILDSMDSLEQQMNTHYASDDIHFKREDIPNNKNEIALHESNASKLSDSNLILKKSLSDMKKQIKNHETSIETNKSNLDNAENTLNQLESQEITYTTKLGNLEKSYNDLLIQKTQNLQAYETAKAYISQDLSGYTNDISKCYSDISTLSNDIQEASQTPPQQNPLLTTLSECISRPNVDCYLLNPDEHTYTKTQTWSVFSQSQMDSGICSLANKACNSNGNAIKALARNSCESQVCNTIINGSLSNVGYAWQDVKVRDNVFGMCVANADECLKLNKYIKLPLQYEYRSEDGILSNPPQTISNTLHTSINGQTMGEPIYFVKDSLANFGTGTNYYPNGTDKPFVIVTDDVAGTSIANLQVTLDAPGTYLYTADLCITTPSTGTAYYNQIEGWLESSSDNGTTWNEILGTYSTIQLGRNHSPRYFRFVRMIEMTASSSLWIRPVLRTHLINSGSSKANTGAIGSPQRTILTHARVSTRAIDTSLPYVNVKSRGNSTALRGKSPVYHADVNAYPYKRQVRNSANVWVDSHQELDLSPIDGMNHYDDLGNITSSLIRYTNTTGPPTFTIEAAGDATPGSPQRVTFKQGGKYLVHLNMHVTVAGPYDSIVDHLNSQYIIQVYLFNPSGNGGQGTYTSIMMDLDRMSKYDGSGTADDCTNQHSYDVLIDIPEGDTNCQLIVYANVDHWYWSERTQYFAITLLEYNITMLPSVGYTQLQGKSGMTVFNGNADDDLITPTGAEYGTSLAVSISNYDENNLEFVGTTINNGDMSIDVGTPSNINVLNAGNYNIKLHGILDLKTTATAASQELISKYGGVVLTLVVYNNDGSVKSDNVRELMSNMYPSTKNEKYKRTYTNKTTAPAISLVQQAYALHVMINFEVQDIVLEAGEYIRFHVSMFRNNPWNKVTTVTMVSNDFSEDTSSLIIQNNLPKKS